MIPRLWIDQRLAKGVSCPLDDAQARYLRQVLRRADGDPVRPFNAVDGEFDARLVAVGRHGAELALDRCRRPPLPEPGPWLLFAPLKRQATDWLVEKATELGAERLVPVVTRRTTAERVTVPRLAAIARESAEQCGRLTVPTVAGPVALYRLAADWPADRLLLVARPPTDGPGLAAGDTAARYAGGAPFALLVGPEGGFAPGELDALREIPLLHAIALGPRVLRAETAAIAGLAILQAVIGDGRAPIDRTAVDGRLAEPQDDGE
jgi:16S rRNA (uracil1498-N3)-methyltransferase